MLPITIAYSLDRSDAGGPGAVKEPDRTSCYRFSPCFEARQGGELLVRGWVRLTLYAATLAEHQLKAMHSSGGDAAAALEQMLIRYGARQMEALMRSTEANDGQPGAPNEFWRVTEKELDELLLLDPQAGSKTCDYQQQAGRDLLCTATAPGDKTATRTWNGQPAAPTSRAVCKGCELPDSDMLCSNLLHPAVNGNYFASGLLRRTVLTVLCDLGNEDVRDVSGCRAGGHACWERHIVTEPTATQPLSPLALPEQFDVLDAYWRLTFGTNTRLVSLSTVSGPASLALPCRSRAEFESRLSTLADIIDKLKTDDSLLPAMTDQEKADKIKGSLDALELALKTKLPAEHHPGVEKAVRSLRAVRQARNIVQHAVTSGGGLTAKLRQIGIHNAPPDWADAWDIIRTRSADALTILRRELQSALDHNA